MIYLDGSGSYGTNGSDDAAADALLLSAAADSPCACNGCARTSTAGIPRVRPQLLDLRGGIDAQGHIVAWEDGDVVAGGPSRRPARCSAPKPPESRRGTARAPALMTQNADPPYAAANVKVVAHSLKETPLRLSNLRAPGKIANVFAAESFADEMAARPASMRVVFRLSRAHGPARASSVLKRAAADDRLAGATFPQSPARRRAICSSAGASPTCATSKPKTTWPWRWRSRSIAPPARSRSAASTCAHDCGLIVNPDGLRNQVEGNIVQT